MTKAYKCDQCSVLYEPFDQTYDLKAFGLSGVIQLHVPGSDSDLCPRCYSELLFYYAKAIMARAKLTESEIQ